MTVQRLLLGFETHRPDIIAEALATGVDPNQPIDGLPPLDCLIRMYLRSPRLPDCVRVLTGAGAKPSDRLLLALACDDAEFLNDHVSEALEREFDLPCAFTSLSGVSALHVCAEYNAVACAQKLLQAGADVNVRARVHEDGTGGHTPIFHTVNAHQDFAAAMRALLLAHQADLEVCVPALSWGRGFDWETTLFAVTPISFAQCGLLPQFQRDGAQIYAVIASLHAHLHSKAAPIRNVPNRYLQP